MDNKMNCKIPDPRGNFRKVVIPAAMGDDSGEFAPQNGAYHDALVKYEANGAIYIYSSDGIPTKISNTIDGLKALAFKDKADYDEDIINKPEIPEKTSDLVNDSGFITSAYHDASKQDVLTAGSNITIENDVISATVPSPTWGSITGTISNQTDLQNALGGKQNIITAGTNLSFSGNTLNAVDTTYTAGTNITIDSNNVISATGGPSYEFIEEGTSFGDKYLSIGDYDFGTENGGMFSYYEQYDGPDLTSRTLLSRGLDYADLKFNNEFLVSDLDDNASLLVIPDGVIMAYDEDSSIAVADGFAVMASGDTTVMAEDGSFSIRTAAAYYNHNGVPQPEDEIATVGYVDEHAGGGTQIEAGKGIKVEEYTPLSITMEVTGQIPMYCVGALPLTLNLSDIKPGTSMYDLYTEGTLVYEQMLYWHNVYTMSTSGIDSDVISVVLKNGYYYIQFNGVGTTTGTITATGVNGTQYPVNVTVTITASEPINKISEDIYDLGRDFFDCVEPLDFDHTVDGEDALAALGGHDGFVEFVKAAKNNAKFIINYNGEIIYFETIASVFASGFPQLTIQHQSSDFLRDASRYDISFEEGDDESIEIRKNRAIDEFNSSHAGIVPATGPSPANKYLRGNRTWQTLNTYTLTLTFDDNTTATLKLKGE